MLTKIQYNTESEFEKYTVKADKILITNSFFKLSSSLTQEFLITIFMLLSMSTVLHCISNLSSTCSNLCHKRFWSLCRQWNVLRRRLCADEPTTDIYLW